jgi:biopolymer transport protein ExbD
MKHHMPDSHSSHPNVVPLIDIIMCLIIFYMLIAKIGVDTGEDESIKLPFGLLGKEMKSMDNTLLVNVKEVNGLPEMSALVDSTSGKGRETLVLAGGGSGRKFDDVLKKLRKDFGNEFKLIIRGDKDMSFAVLQQVLLAAAQANVKSLNFQTVTKEEQG